MNMSEFSKASKLSAHTLRYYEKIGLLSVIERNASGHRVYADRDLEWVRFIIRLKETGMSLENILEYSQLRAQGNTTITQRRQLLEQHRDTLKSRIESELGHLAALEAKIEFYKSHKAP